MLMHQDCIYLIANTVKTVILSNIIIFLNCFLFAYILCDLFLDGKAEFSALLLQSAVSHDCSEIILICWFGAQERFLIMINVENSCIA